MGVSVPSRRAKRSSKQIEENYWDCSVCKYSHSVTRKPKVFTKLLFVQVHTEIMLKHLNVQCVMYEKEPQPGNLL